MRRVKWIRPIVLLLFVSATFPIFLVWPAALSAGVETPGMRISFDVLMANAPVEVVKSQWLLAWAIDTFILFNLFSVLYDAAVLIHQHSSESSGL